MPHSNFQPGQTISGTTYRVESIIGSGAAGTVYKCTEMALNRPVAVKVLNSWSESFPNLTAIKRMEREAKLLSGLIHKNIVRIYRIGFLDESLPFISMEYLDGISLRDYLTEKQSLSTRLSLLITKAVAEALAYAHKHGVIHRDLKPENIIILHKNSQLPEVKIIDFGLSKTASKSTTLTDPGDLIGTVLYMSPEQCMAKALDARSDIYSLACILYEMLTGKAPFEGINIEEVLLKHLTETAPTLKSDSPLINDLQNVIHRCLQKKPEDRYQSAEELATELSTILDKIGDADIVLTELKVDTKESIWAPQRILRASLIAMPVALLGIIFALLISPSIRIQSTAGIAKYLSPNLRYELEIAEIEDLAKVDNNEKLDYIKVVTQENQPQNLSFEQESDLLGHYFRLASKIDKKPAYEVALTQLKNICRFVLQVKSDETSNEIAATINNSIDWFNEFNCSKTQWRSISSTIERASAAFKPGGTRYLWRLSELRADALLGAHPGDAMLAEEACRHYIYAIQQALIFSEEGTRRLERKVKEIAGRYNLNKALFRVSLAMSLYYASSSKWELLKAEFPNTQKLAESCAISGSEQGNLLAIKELLDNPDKEAGARKFHSFLEAW